MNLDECLNTIKNLGHITQPLNENNVVLAEFETTSTELHNIANGQCCTLNDDVFGLRFLLRSSFKSSKSNFVINKLVIQVLAHDKHANVFRKEHIAVKTKVEKVVKKVEVKTKYKEPIQQEVDFSKKEQETLF